MNAERKLFVGCVLSFAVFAVSGVTGWCEDSGGTPVSSPRETDLLRVAVVRGAKSLNLKIEGDYRICGLAGGEMLKTGSGPVTIAVVPAYPGLKFADEDFRVSGIRIIPGKDARLYLDRRLFLGELDLIPEPDQTLEAVNYAPLSDYLAGTVAVEMPGEWPPACLKAQAVAARTFALYHREKNRGLEFDVFNPVFAAVPPGSGNAGISRAVAETRGEVLTFAQKLFPAFYHACCGGHTETANAVWNGIDKLDPLRGVACSYCQDSPGFRWEQKLGLDEIRQRLEKAGFPYQEVFAVRVDARDDSGRATAVAVEHATGTFVFSGVDLRMYLGPAVIKSTRFTTTAEPGAVIFSGTGFGHGVGLCQWGACALARQGKDYREILKYYFPGAEITRRPDAGSGP